MAYRKTPEITADIESRRAAIISAAEWLITKFGVIELTTDRIASRAGLSVGLIYKHFPDKGEIVATMIGGILSDDLAALRAAIADIPPQAALARAIAVIYGSMKSSHLNAVLFASPVYRDGLLVALGRVITAATPLRPVHAKLCSAAVVGSTRGIWEAVVGEPRGMLHAVHAAFRIAGFGNKTAGTMIEKYSIA